MDPWMVEVLNYGIPQVMIAPVILAALISGGGSLLGGLLGGQSHDPGRIADPYKDPLTAALSAYFMERVGQNRPGYEGQLTADYNPVLLDAISQITQRSEGFNDPIQQLISGFMQPGGNRGWSPAGGGAGGAGVSSNVMDLISRNLGGG